MSQLPTQSSGSSATPAVAPRAQPESRTLAVANPELAEVMDRKTGEIRSAQKEIGDDFERAHQLRMALRDAINANSPLLACPLCTVPVHLVSLPHVRRFYFRHERGDGRCPFQTKTGLSEDRILALKYNGARESDAHRRMKEIIAESLRSDPEFSDVVVEGRWVASSADEWRQPDVRALWRGKLRVAFEVQLSTTFLRVIAARRQFYLREGGLLLWVFKQFDMGDARITQDDIFYNNNRNAFLASEETLEASRAASRLLLDCAWAEPSVEDGRLLWSPRSGRVQFADLTIDRDTQRVFHYDADGAKEACRIATPDEQLRADFRRYWLADRWDEQAWGSLGTRLQNRGILLPRYPDEQTGFRPLLDTLYSAAEGHPVIWRYPDLVKLAHHVFDKHKGALWAFKLLLVAHKRAELVCKHDPTRNWRDKKVPAYRAAWKRGDPAFAPDRRFDGLVCFLFPEIAEALPKGPH